MLQRSADCSSQFHATRPVQSSPDVLYDLSPCHTTGTATLLKRSTANPQVQKSSTKMIPCSNGICYLYFVWLGRTHAFFVAAGYAASAASAHHHDYIIGFRHVACKIWNECLYVVIHTI